MARERYEDWTTEACVEGGESEALDSGGSAPIDDVDLGSPFLNPTGATAEQIADAITIASDILFGRTGEVLTGISPPREFRPCRRYANGWPAFLPYRLLQTSWGGDQTGWANLGSRSWFWWDGWGTCNCGGNPCTCGFVSRIGLGVYPIHEVVEILIDGEELDPSAYRLVDHQWLDRLDGEVWPLCQDVFADASEDNTFQPVVTIGRTIPEGAQAVACIYAREIALAFADSEFCALPNRIGVLVRQGVSVNFHDPSDLLKNGLTGIDLVDQWVDSFNGGKKPVKPSTFIVPDYRPHQQAAQLGAWRPT